MEKRPLILIGGGGHSRVLIGLLKTLQWPVGGIITSTPELVGQEIMGVRVLGLEEGFPLDPRQVALVNGVGNKPSRMGSALDLRANVFRRYRERGFDFPTLVSPYAIVAPDVAIADGAQVMAGAVVQPCAQLGENCIVNTRAVVDHETIVGAHAHIAPGAVLCGQVTIGEEAHIGAGAVVIQGMTVGREAVVGAGATVYRPVQVGTVLLASPSVKLKERD